MFNIWLDNQCDWDKLKCHVERERASLDLSRKEWTAVQAKTLKAELSEERFEDLIKRRTDAGLYYPDEDYPSDPMDQGLKPCCGWFDFDSIPVEMYGQNIVIMFTICLP